MNTFQPRNSATQLPFVDLCEAVRMIVRLMNDGNHLASFMTDQWIQGGARLLYGSVESASGSATHAKYGPDHDAIMKQMYGPAWRDVMPRVKGAFGDAKNSLTQILQTGSVPGVAISNDVHRDVKIHEWASRQLSVEKGALLPPAGKSIGAYPVLLDVRVSTKELSEKIAATVSPAEPPSQATPDPTVNEAKEPVEPDPGLDVRVANFLRTTHPGGRPNSTNKSLLSEISQSFGRDVGMRTLNRAIDKLDWPKRRKKCA